MNTTKKLPDPTDPSTWTDSAIIKQLESTSKGQPALVEYMRRTELRVNRQKDLMRLLVSLLRQKHVALIDLEATCYDRPEDDGKAKEVIEVGWALLDIESLTVVDKRQLYIKPTTSYVSSFCTKLTGISPTTVAFAPSYRSVMQELKQLHEQHPRGPVKVWGSFGDYDRKQLERQCLAEDAPYPLTGSQHFNLKEASATFFGFGKKSPGLARSVGLAGLEFYGQHHSGVDDAVNAARVLAHILSMSLPTD